MVRKRGGGSNGDGKRQATTPVSGPYKDARRNIQGDEEYEEEEDQWTQVIYNKSKSPPISQALNETQSQVELSYAGAASGATSKNLDQHMANPIRKERPKLFLTPAPEGSMRDNIVIEAQTVNGSKFKGSLNFEEAKKWNFQEQTWTRCQAYSRN